IFKQFATMFFSNALSNPAGAAFGPLIGVMVLFYFIWRITLYCSAWAATTPEPVAMMTPPVPPAAVSRVRQEVRSGCVADGRCGRDSGRGHPLDLQISRQFFTGLYRAGDLSPPARHHGAQLLSKLCPMIDSDVIASLPKVELHDHLDGGLRPATIVELAAEIG